MRGLVCWASSMLSGSTRAVQTNVGWIDTSDPLGLVVSEARVHNIPRRGGGCTLIVSTTNLLLAFVPGMTLFAPGRYTTLPRRSCLYSGGRYSTRCGVPGTSSYRTTT